ncbi:MAG TPA: hypothetical protein VD966_12460, partial [Pyrinomonadaceae bacterium]|nr:hypothetical protein [Pyrinomonadaceae bacterium]
MRRTQDKIKDLIEAQSFDEVQNYAGEPARALAAYRFTTDTSDLLARWLDALADLPRNRGAARALAGLRGVGKSHTLAAFSALAAVPDLRSTVADAHVATCARRLLSRPYLITRVERGTRPTLQEELAAAFAEVFGGGEEHWTGAPAQMLAVAASMSGAPFVLTIDTAVGREARVRRDDGALLSELATATQHINAFIALALDDDIEGADGANVGLSETFQIDYLDPEHLYRIADLYLFQKTPQARAALHDIYTTLRTSVSGFNWSEPRFTAIYPVHPIVVDVASAVRLYAPKFAFLPFAAAAGARATNRPAQSLIVLDEVFDRTEHDLRKAEDLKDAFVAYDELATHAITQFPAMQRLQAKLVLKGLFILSLDGRGATARELGAAMLLDDDSPNIAVERIEDMLARFAEALPQGSLQRSVDESETRYRFIISASADFDAALAERACQIAIDSPAISDLLRVVARARFADWPFAGDGKRVSTEADFTVIWRGMGRHGRLAWQASGESHAPLAARLPEDFIPLDWEMVIFAPGVAAGGAPVDGSSERTAGPECSNAPAPAVWRPAQLSAEETEGLRRLIALRTDGALLAEFGEIARAAERTHTALAERIWARIYVDDGELVLNQTAHAFSNKAR